MALTKWEPLREIEEMFDRYTKAMGWPLARGSEPMTAADWTPKVDISETDSQILIKADIPGVAKEDVKVTLENGMLSIRGERRQEKEDKGEKFHRIERSYGSFYRSFSLPRTVDAQAIKASFDNGMLQLILPKTASASPDSVEIKVE